MFPGGDDSTDGDGAKNEAREEAEGDLVVRKTDLKKRKHIFIYQ